MWPNKFWRDGRGEKKIYKHIFIHKHMYVHNSSDEKIRSKLKTRRTVAAGEKPTKQQGQRQIIFDASFTFTSLCVYV